MFTHSQGGKSSHLRDEETDTMADQGPIHIEVTFQEQKIHREIMNYELHCKQTI